MIRMWIGAGIFAALSLIGWLAWSYYKDSEAEKARLLVENTKIQIALESAQKTAEEIKKQQAQQTIFVNELNEVLAKSENPVRDLQELFSKHNLTILSLEKPSLIEKRINNATKKAFDSIECSTGSC